MSNMEIVLLYISSSSFKLSKSGHNLLEIFYFYFRKMKYQLKMNRALEESSTNGTKMSNKIPSGFRYNERIVCI